MAVVGVAAVSSQEEGLQMVVVEVVAVSCGVVEEGELLQRHPQRHLQLPTEATVPSPKVHTKKAPPAPVASRADHCRDAGALACPKTPTLPNRMRLPHCRAVDLSQRWFT